MKFLIRLTLACLTCALAGAGEPGVPVNQNVARILESSPLRFEPDTSVAGFVARGARYRFEFSKNEARLHATQGDLKVEFARASREARLEGQDPLRSRTNVYIGNDPAQWRKAVVNYSRLRVRNLYPGVDLSYYGNQGELEYDLNVAPGADPRAIRIKLHGEHAHLDADGNLIAGLIEKKPVAYQTTDNGSRVPVSSRYRKNRDGSFGFELGAYDRSRELVIDPVLTVSSYLYGSLQDIAYSVGVDSKGFIYVGGTTYSTDFTTNGNSYQSTNGGAPDVFVAKIDPNFRDVVYATYFGGTGIDTLGGLAVGPNGDMYLAGTTSSGNFPSINPYQQTLKSQSTTNTRNAFVAWFDANQNLNYSTYFGGTGSEDATAVAVDAKGNIWFTGGTTSNDMPLVNPIQNGLFFGQDMFVAEINPDTNGPKSLLYSTYLGGSHYDVGLGIAVAPDQTIWVVGQTFSPDIEINGQPLQGSYQGNGDGWVAHFDPSLGANGMLYASYLGGSDQDSANAVAVDSNGRAAIAGYTLSTNFPVTSSALQPAYGGNTDAFVSVIDSTAASGAGSLVYSTYFGGPQGDVVYAVAVDSGGAVYATGYTMSGSLAASTNALQPAYDQSLDAFVLKLNPAHAGLAGRDYFSYLGSDGLQVGYGIAVDSNGNVYVVGGTSGPLLAAFGGVGKATAAGNTDAFLAGFNPCGYSLSPGAYQFPSGGASIPVEVTSGGSCPWTVSNSLGWVTAAPSAGIGNGVVTLTVGPNTSGAAQRGTLSIGGVTFTVGQDQ